MRQAAGGMTRRRYDGRVFTTFWQKRDKMNYKMNFTMKQLQTIENALQIAYDQYIEDFAAMSAANQPRIAAQFEKQAQACGTLKDFFTTLLEERMLSEYEYNYGPAERAALENANLRK